MSGRGLLLLVAAAAAQPACSEPCCTYDSQPIPLTHATNGELLAQVSVDGTASATQAVIDTGSPLTIWNTAGGSADVQRRDIRLLGLAAPAGDRPRGNGVCVMGTDNTCLP